MSQPTKMCPNKGCAHHIQKKVYPSWASHCSWCENILTTIPAKEFKSQKAKGLSILNSYVQDFFPLNVSTPHVVVSTAEELEKWWKTFVKKDQELTDDHARTLFARPCPKVPRHGFVDSRVIHTYGEAKKVLEETLAADPEGEMMLAEPIDATHNAVITNGLLTLGKGNDGATAGKGVVNFPLPPKLEIDPYLLTQAGITEAPYFEAVKGKSSLGWILTQLRNGPVLSGGASDFIPTQITIQKVITPNEMDLLEWEKLIISLKDTPGVVVNNPTGSLVDHYSVHARCSGIPVITTRVVIEGETLEAIEGNKLDPTSVLEGVAVADSIDLGFPSGNEQYYHKTDAQGRSVKAWCDLSIACFHGGNNAGGDQSWWLGLGAGLLMRYGSLACRGEARHINQHNKLSRNSVYHAHSTHSIARHRAALPRLIHTLRYGNFGGTSVGGIKWAQCGKAIGDMLDALAVLAAKRDQDSLNNLIKAYNVALNQAHNNGWWLNKFTSQDAFTGLQNGDIPQALALYGVIEEAARVHTEGNFSRKLSLWAKWKPLSYRIPSVDGATMEIDPGFPGVVFKVNDRFLRAKRKPISIQANTFLPKLMEHIGGRVSLVTGNEGMKLILNTEKGEEVLWQEGTLTPQAVQVKQ